MISRASTFLGPKGFFHGGGGTPSLVLSLDTLNSSSYNQLTPEIWYDLSIRHNNGLLNDVSSLTSSIPSTSLQFNGTGSFVSFTQSSGIPSATSSKYTIEAWFNSNSYGPSEQGSIIGWGTTGETASTNVLRLGGNGLVNYWWGDDISFSLSGTSSMVAGNWYYAAATYDGTYRNLYLNGELKATDTPGVYNAADTATLKVGYFYNNYFNGRISQIKVNDKALGQGTILGNFNTNKITYGYVFGSMTLSSSSNSYLISTSPDYAFGTNDFTVEAFFNPSLSTLGYGGVVSLRMLTTTDVAINIQSANTTTPYIEFSSSNDYTTFTASNGTWYHAAISRTGGTSSYFVNGKLVKEVADGTNYTNNDLVVGKYYTNYAGYYFNGIISNVRVINGTGLYTTEFTTPKVQLSATYSGTKFLINSQQTTPTADLSGMLHSVTASNIGWTSSLPIIYEFNYPDFSSTAGLELISIFNIIGNSIYLTSATGNDVGNVYRSTPLRFDRSFNLEFNFECSGGDGADGFCVQWCPTNNTNGNLGGDVASVYTSIELFKFTTFGSQAIRSYQTGVQTAEEPITTLNIRQNVYYWMYYRHEISTMYIYYSTSNAKPISQEHTFMATFDSGEYYLGFGAATGGSTDNHILKSMSLRFV